jgi:DNA-binding MarR family transcriptional regulator
MTVRRKLQSKIGPAEAGFVLEDYVLYNLVRTAATYNEEMAKALKRYRLDTIKWRVLMLLNDKSPSSVGELARRSVTKTPTLTRVLIRMENEGLIVRRAQAGDKRFVQVTMTPKAVKTLKEVQAIGQRVFERALEGVDGVEAAALTAVLKRMRANLSRSPYEASAFPRLSARAS